MFHVVFNADKSHIKYLSVLCYSIICHSSGASKRGGFAFHILTDKIDVGMRAKMAEFEVELSKLCPCKIDFYLLDDEKFHGLPKLNENYLTYFRLKIASVLPQEIQRCLYLDVDMLCLSDITELFSLDLEGKVCGMVRDAHYRDLRVMPSINPREGGGLALDVENYFNAGLILIDLQAWREEKVEDRSFEFLSNYIPEWHDQDTLNAVLSKEVLPLPLKWNLMEGHFGTSGMCFKGEQCGYKMAYTEAEYHQAKAEVKLVHFVTHRKPWQRIDGKLIPYRKLWWEFAFQTPCFGDEFHKLYLLIIEETIIGFRELDMECKIGVRLQAWMKKTKRSLQKSLNFLRSK